MPSCGLSGLRTGARLPAAAGEGLGHRARVCPLPLARTDSAWAGEKSPIGVVTGPCTMPHKPRKVHTGPPAPARTCGCAGRSRCACEQRPEREDTEILAEPRGPLPVGFEVPSQASQARCEDSVLTRSTVPSISAPKNNSPRVKEQYLSISSGDVLFPFAEQI